MGSGNEPGFQNGPGMMLEKLDLTKDQQEKVDKLKGNHQKEAGTLRDDLAKLRIDKKAMLREDNVKKDALLDVEKKMNDIQGKLAILNTNFMLDIRDVLSPEQRSKLKDMNMKGGMRHQRGGHERGSEDSPKN